jgi:RNA polymerase sigma-70 factor (ECF subfamily)
LHRFFRNKVSDGIDDLIQKTLLSCVESKQAVRNAGSFRVYLFRIARHRLYDRLRTELRVGADVALSDASLHDLGASPSSVVARDERQALVVEALRRIPLDYQITLELCYWEGMTALQIAEVLELNSNTVRSRMNRARAALREQIESMGGVGLQRDETLPS